MERTAQSSLSAWWPLVRWLLGIAVVVCFQWGWRPEILSWQLFYFGVGLVAAWVAGPPWSVLIAPWYLWIDGALRIFSLSPSALQWPYLCNVLDGSRQFDIFAATVAFSLFATAGGLCGWGSTIIIRGIGGRTAARRPPLVQWGNAVLQPLLLAGMGLSVVLLFANWLIRLFVCPLPSPPPWPTTITAPPPPTITPAFPSVRPLPPERTDAWPHTPIDR